ncbi:uncharacterized protein LOC109722725 isoform X2 [Ananas comosus]|uniref:Uncharacterized protein LOC109722725 isoform X2 n=1 Tax=Ananas comosus TaxID=4615 RepID=A0A6P5GCV5_ANACO|nr:uncharacterized protein LOC109722725 isoform X2 [Ananas comosus]
MSSACCSSPKSSSLLLRHHPAAKFRPLLFCIQIQSSQNPSPASLKRTTRRRSLLVLSLPLSTLLLLPPNPTTSSSSSSSAAAAAAAFDPLTEAERSASAVLDRRVADAVRLLDLARDLQAQGDFPRALLYFTQGIKRLPGSKNCVLRW